MLHKQIVECFYRRSPPPRLPDPLLASLAERQGEAGCVPRTPAALWALATTFNTFAILDGTVVRIDRLGGVNDRRYYSGKHRHHGVNLQGLTDSYGQLI